MFPMRHHADLICAAGERFSLKWLFLAAWVLGVGFGCGSIPTQEMSDARQALEAARAVGAAQYAPLYLERAEVLLEQAEGALEDGEYGVAQTQAARSKKESLKARSRALTIVQEQEP